MAEEVQSTVAEGLRGTYYEDTIPDTLDLAERAEYGLNYFTQSIEEKLDHEMYYYLWFNRYYPPIKHSHGNSVLACQCKALEAMAFERTMSGSRLHLEREAGMLNAMVSMLGEDGLYWVKGGQPNKPWSGIAEPLAHVHGQGRMLRAMVAWYQYTGDPAWKRRIDRMVDGLDRLMVVHQDDYAYFPTHGYYEDEYLRSCYTPRGWKDTSEPQDEKHGEEGSLFAHQGHHPGVLATWYQMTGNEQALRLSGELVRFLTKPRFWADWEAGEYPLVTGAEHAHWQGHLHGHVCTLRAILDYALATDDARLKAFVRDGYEWSRQVGFARIGYFDRQGCATTRLIGLAAKLSDAGAGDYWEDVDQYIRNHGVEMQATPEDVEWLHWRAEHRGPVVGAYWNTPQDESTWLVDPPGINREGVFQAAIGGFAGFPTKDVFMLCCGTQGNMGLFYAWDGIVRCDGGTARVNLLLNRASPWLDVHSYLPYEGKAVIKNKTAQEAFVRIPLWVDRKAIRCTVGEQERSPVWFGNYLRFQDLRPGDVLTIEFPMVETTEKWTVQMEVNSRGEKLTQVHTCRFRGNTLVEITPALVPGSPLYFGRPERFSAKHAPMKRATRYVSPVVLHW